ncbi:hypothetical protein METBIDRAFT_45716 [Metschnikowia bicuspidata var. bicuspidata NRRL YB-4993]|uniref:Golgi apparatus membrane protein TVP38 n=1 Tax=Metschnikowia bicuspidata var. bicuspidata NRRL YB-4993 TaxID=869754 RepID=A0A1A0H619_9ASCO|nr:hypothetical protein METBIDRAFT_45716 [Metschnikowia bicuspidata var. bicuspidata NRRL YB-4993]OBA19476.1 hypothetical protein METBIDRAFT_45716 [Metschnikowia bicuspidata var. bicuspidata NRRL YB-4993]
MLQTQVQILNDLGRTSSEWFQSQLTKKKALCIVGGLLGFVAGVTLLVFHKRFIAAMADVSDLIRASKFGGLALFVAIFFVGFPPLLGFSALSMLCGMVYGFPGGWPLLAAASTIGSFASFMVYRYFLRNQAERLVARNEKFRAFAEILKEDASLFLLILLRLCPLPYSLSNGALAAIPNLPASTYLLASVITSPKMFMHVFIGHTIKNLGDAERPAAAKALDVFSILLTGCAVSLASYIIYRRMQQKLESYHERGPNNDAMYEDLVFGDFGESPELGTNLELDAAEFDDDHFIIADDDEDLPAGTNARGLDLLDEPQELGKPPKYRDY